MVEVSAAGTSQTCSTCGQKDKKSRNKKQFQCTSCGYTADADHNAALNIGDKGTHLFVKRTGATLEEIRRQRISRADGKIQNGKSREQG